MELIHRQIRGVAVIEVRGKLTGAAEDSIAFHRRFQTLLGEGRRRFVVDLMETPWINSLGIGMLIGTYSSVRKAGGEMVIANATERITDVLAVTKLNLVFHVFYTLDEAIDHLTSGRPSNRHAEGALSLAD